MVIDKLWDRLEPETREWFINNPGCVILPRSVAAAVSKTTGVKLELNQHGESSLSAADCDFIQEAAHRHLANASTPKIEFGGPSNLRRAEAEDITSG